ncbi:MAG: hypothetical protein QGG48_12770, partial [Desulfatiglandales bacterium]|nr:hypothetical protein [Desulfatiglandales bacterium]
KKQWTEEQENTAKALEDAGVVDVGLGQGDIEDLKELTLLDPKSLEALLAYQVWSDKDQKLIEDIRDAKVQGIAVNYVPEDVGSKWNPFDNVAESLSYGEVGSAGSPTVNGAPPTVADEDRAVGTSFSSSDNIGTLYYNKAQWEEYKALELVEKATIREAKQIKEAAQEQLKKKLTAEGVPFGSAHFMDEDDPRRAEMLALEEKIEDDAEKMIKEAEEAAFFFRVQMKRDTETQDKLKKNFLDKRKEKERKEKAGATIQPSSGLIPTAESPTVADEDS